MNIRDIMFFNVSNFFDSLICSKYYTTKSGSRTPTQPFNIPLSSLEAQALKDRYNLPKLPLYIFSGSDAYLVTVRHGLLNGMSGIYIWVNPTTGMCYIGSSRNLGGSEGRPYQHTEPAGAKNPNFSAAQQLLPNFGWYLVIIEFGPSTNVIEIDDNSKAVSDNVLKIIEQVYLDCVPRAIQYNTSSSASSPRGKVTKTDEQKAAASKKQSGANNSVYNKPVSEETKRRQREAKRLTMQAISITDINSVDKIAVIYSSFGEAAEFTKLHISGLKHAADRPSLYHKRWLVKRIQS